MFSMHLLVDKYNGGSAGAPAIIIIFQCATIVLPIDGADRDRERNWAQCHSEKDVCAGAGARSGWEWEGYII